MMMTSVNMYRDGGSSEVVGTNLAGHCELWLDTPFRGEPKAMKINGVLVKKDAEEALEVKSILDAWWESLQERMRHQLACLRKHKGPFIEPNNEMVELVDLHRIDRVRVYLYEHYLTARHGDSSEPG